MFSCFGHKKGFDFRHFAAVLVINRISIFLEEATSSSRPPSHSQERNNYKADLKQINDLRVRSQIGYQIFDQVINRLGKIADFGHGVPTPGSNRRC